MTATRIRRAAAAAGAAAAAPRAGTARRWRAWLALAGVAGVAGVLLPAPGASASTPRVDARLVASGLIVPRERPVVRVRLTSNAGTRVRLRLTGAGGRTLGVSRELRLRARRPRVAALALTAAGRRTLGRCGSARVALIVRQAGAPRRRTAARTTADPVRCGPLLWPAPALERPQTIAVGNGFTHLQLEPGRDYVLRLPAGRKLGGTFVEGGRNVVVMGGHLTLTPGTTRDEERRALYFKNQTGVVHVEGVLIDGSGGGEGDAIAVSAPEAIVQIENVRVDGVIGSDEGTHADVLQPWGGVHELRIDRLTGISRFQGLQLPLESAPIGAAYIRFTDLHALTPTASALREPRTGGHMLWLTPPGSCAGYTVGLRDVYVAPRPGRTIDNSVWPQVGDGSACAAVKRNGAVSWPALPVRGEVRVGAPAGGDYVPRASVGEGYRSPGYESGVAAAAALVVTALQQVACRVAALGCGS